MFSPSKLLEALDAFNTTERMDSYALLAFLMLRGPSDHNAIFEAFPPLAPAESTGAFYFAELLQPLKSTGAIIQLEAPTEDGEGRAIFSLSPQAVADILRSHGLTFFMLPFPG